MLPETIAKGPNGLTHSRPRFACSGQSSNLILVGESVLSPVLKNSTVVQRGMALRMNGNFDGAIEDFAVAEKLTPTLSLVIVTLRSLTAIVATLKVCSERSYTPVPYLR
jgi:hypothetical protein